MCNNLNILRSVLVLVLVLVLVSAVIVRADADVHVNLTAFHGHRQRRMLIYANAGSMKLIMGPVFNIPLGDGVSWRSLIYTFNLHVGDYKMPTEPLYPWDKWEDTFARSFKGIRERFDLTGRYDGDQSRQFVYGALESYMSRTGADGRACLLRSICENAQVHGHVGIFSELLNVVLTPGMESIDPVYKEACKLGKSGVDCFRTYRNCPIGVNILDPYLNHL